MPISHDAFTLSNFDSMSIRKLLRSFGLVVVQNYLSAEELKAIKEEIANIENTPECIIKIHQHPNNENGVVYRLRSTQFSQDQKHIIDTMLNERLSCVTRDYYLDRDIILNEEIFFTHEKHDARNILPWHFDRIQSLKFYINLVDVDESNGALEYCLKSHREGTLRGNYHILKGVAIEDIPNDVPLDELYNETVISASAGDLIIFDSAGFHRGGVIEKGKERLVLRGHSHPCDVKKYGEKSADRSATISDSNALLVRAIKS